MQVRLLVCRLVLPLLLAAATAAHSQDDLVVLTNGSRMIGTIREMARGELQFSVAGARRVFINWNHVESLQSPRRFDIGLLSGERLSGSINTLPPGRLEVATDAGPKVIELKDVSRIDPIEATFLERTSGEVDLGFEFLTAHDERDWTFNAELANRTENYLTEMSINSLVRRVDGETNQQRNKLEIGSRRFLHDRWFAIGLFEAEEDRELDLDLRILVGAAMGRTLIESRESLFAVYGGLDVSHEEYRGVSDADQDVVEVLGAVEWDQFELIGGDFHFLVEATTYVAVDDGRVRFVLDGSLRRDITDNYFLSLNVYESYNSDPPQDLEKSDLGVSLTIGRDF